MKHVGTHGKCQKYDFSFWNKTRGIQFYLVHVLKQAYLFFGIYLCCSMHIKTLFFVRFTFLYILSAPIGGQVRHGDDHTS